MKNDDIDILHYNTYYYSNVINNLLTDRFAFLRTLHDLFENGGHLEFIMPFPKDSALHVFIRFCLELEFFEDLESEYVERTIQRGKPALPINHAMKVYGIDYPPFEEWRGEALPQSDVRDELFDYFQDMRVTQDYEMLLNRLSDEVFYILFLNRALLSCLHELISVYTSQTFAEELDADQRRWFDRDGVLKRQRIPQWARKAVFYRDRGACAICRTDLSGVVRVTTGEHYDHIIPLAEGGVNDVTNLQLLCSRCNRSKGKKLLATSTKYERWYPVTDGPGEDD